MITGYGPYVESVADLAEGKELVVSGMKREVDRCRWALARAAEGETVSLVSSGDSGVYGMAGLALELAAASGVEVDIVVVPGVTAALAAAAELGAPLMCDFAVVSLSDLLTPLEVIERRLDAAASADFVIALYNPKSHTRTEPFRRAMTILRRHLPAETPCGVVAAVGSPEARVNVTRLYELDHMDIDMRTIVIVGNSRTEIIRGRMVTRRGYDLDKA